MKISVRNANITAIPITQDARIVRQKERTRMKITIDIPQSDIPYKQGIIWVEIHFINGQVCECDYPFEVEQTGQAMTKEEELTEVLRKTRELMLQSIMEESGKIELIYKEIAEYPAPVIPKKEALEIINRVMKGSKG